MVLRRGIALHRGDHLRGGFRQQQAFRKAVSPCGATSLLVKSKGSGTIKGVNGYFKSIRLLSAVRSIDRPHEDSKEHVPRRS